VDDKYYQVLFRFTGKINKLTVKLGPEELSAPEKSKIAKVFRDKQEAPSRPGNAVQMAMKKEVRMIC
jgi:hypothetical protein